MPPPREPPPCGQVDMNLFLALCSVPQPWALLQQLKGATGHASRPCSRVPFETGGDRAWLLGQREMPGGPVPTHSSSKPPALWGGLALLTSDLRGMSSVQHPGRQGRTLQHRPGGGHTRQRHGEAPAQPSPLPSMAGPAVQPLWVCPQPSDLTTRAHSCLLTWTSLWSLLVSPCCPHTSRRPLSPLQPEAPHGGAST